MSLVKPAKEKDIVFRRIKGRIVPIKRNKPKNGPERGKATALVAGGLAVALASGEAAASAVKHAARIRAEAKVKFGVAHRALKRANAGQTSFSFMPGIGSRQAAQKSAAKSRAFSRSLFKTRNLVLAAGALLGGSLISEGLERMRTRNETVGESVVADVIGGVAAGITGAVYYRRLGVKGLGALFHLTRARVKGKPRGIQIPINFKSRVLGKGTLKF